MKRLLFLLLLLFAAPAYADTLTSLCGTPCDNFNRASLGTTNWTQVNDGYGSTTISGNTVVTASSNYAYTYGGGVAAKWIGTGTFTDNQYAAVRLIHLEYNTTDIQIGACINITGADAKLSMWCAVVDGTVDGTITNSWHTRLYKVVSGTVTSITDSNQTWTANDDLAIANLSNTITVYRNGVALGGAFTHACVSSCPGTGGAPGMTANSSMTGDDFQAGSVTAGGAPAGVDGALIRRRTQ